MKLFEKISTTTTSAVKEIHQRSALNPLLWLVGVTIVPSLSAAVVLQDHPTVLAALIVLGFLPVVAVCGVAIYFAVRKPERLQSEDYLIRHEALEMIGVKAASIQVDPTSIELLAAPGGTRRLASENPARPDV
jgi:hypothetical protein